MKENNMKPRHNRSGLQGSEKRSLIQRRPTACASQTNGAKPFTGKVFYLDLASNKVAETLESDIKDLGGTVEKFFSKEIKYLISNKREAKYVQYLRQDSPIPSPESGPSSPQPCSNPHQPQSHGHSTKSTSQLQKDAVATSRGKSLVKRVVKEQERIQMNKILSNALDWGIKILYLDDVIAYVQKKKMTCREKPATTAKKNIKSESTKRGFQKSKDGRISKPFVKVEDLSRHYRPFYLSLTNVPEFNLTTLPPCTPFCTEDKGAPGNRAYGHRGGRPSVSDERLNERKKKKQGGYCECCLIKYDNITTHLRSDQHQTFAKSDQYAVVDKLVSEMHCNFTHFRSKLKRQKCSVSSGLIAPGPFLDKGRHADVVVSAVNVEMHQSSFNNEGRTEEWISVLDTKPLCPAVPDVHRIYRRRKQSTFSESQHKPKQPCYQHLRVEVEHDPHLKGELAPPTGDEVAAHSVLHNVQFFPDRTGEPHTVKVQTETSPESLIETKISKPVSLCGTALSGSLVHKQKTDNCVFQTYNSSEDFVPVERIRRKIKVYKGKRRKMPSPVASDCVELKHSSDDGIMKLWELFQASDDMDSEFYGFE